MSTWRTLLDSERGVALPLALIVLLALTLMAVTFISLGAIEPQISQNLSDGARARQLADAGIEWAFNALVGQDLTAKLAGAGPCPGGVMCAVLAPSGTALPGVTAAQGTFGVTIRNDVFPGDEKLTGYVSPGGAIASLDDAGSSATSDVNGIVILTSTGTFRGATRQTTAVVRRGVLNVNAALALPGVQTDTFSDTPCPTAPCPPNPLRAYSIDGRDWKQSDAGSPTGINPMRLGISTQFGIQSNVGISYELNAEAAFSDTYRRNYVQGRDQSTGLATSGLNTIAPDTALSPAILQAFVSNLAANPSTQIIPSTQLCQFPAGGAPRSKPEGLRMSATGTAGIVNIANNCTGASQINQTVNLGTLSSPAMVYVKGEFDPSSLFIGLAVQGSLPIQGYGILVMEEADLSFFQTSNFRWDGIVLVTGRNVGVGFRAGSNTEIRGTLIASETNPGEAGGFFEFLNQSNSMLIRYSKQNVDMALRGLYDQRITSWREN
jgi:hypothetical protein